MHPPVAPTRSAIQPEKTPYGTNSAYLWKTRPPAIPKASPRTLAVAGHRHKPVLINKEVPDYIGTGADDAAVMCYLVDSGVGDR
jgi:hypothetical protein